MYKSFSIKSSNQGTCSEVVTLNAVQGVEPSWSLTCIHRPMQCPGEIENKDKKITRECLWTWTTEFQQELRQVWKVKRPQETKKKMRKTMTLLNFTRTTAQVFGHNWRNQIKVKEGNETRPTMYVKIQNALLSERQTWQQTFLFFS